MKQLIFTLTLLSTLFISAQNTPNGQTIEKIIAKVDNEIVLLSELEKTYIQYKHSGAPNSPNLKCKVLESLLINKLLVAKASIDSVTVETDVINRELDRRMKYILSQFGGDEEELKKAYGKTSTQLKTELRPQIKEQMLVQRMQAKITGDIKMTPKEIQGYFDKIPKDSLPFISTEVEIAQVVRYPKTSERQKADVSNQLAEIKKRVENGEDFCKLASIYSEDPGSKNVCGQLGYRKRGELVPEFEATALSMNPGEISEPIKSQFGYHLIQLIDRRGNEYAARHILITVKTGEENYTQSLNLLDSLRSQVLANDSIDFNHVAHKFNEDKASKNMGNRITDNNGNTRVSAENLGPNLYFIIDGMKEGEISKPMKFQTTEGKTAVRIIQLISKKAPHVANLEDDYKKISLAGIESKKAKTLDNWFKKTLPEVYISIDKKYQGCKVLQIDKR